MGDEDRVNRINGISQLISVNLYPDLHRPRTSTSPFFDRLQNIRDHFVFRLRAHIAFAMQTN
jgi:hypothetical protein